MSDRLELSVPGKAEYLRHIRALCEGIMKDAGFEDAPVQEFNLALTEACANTIEHCLGLDPTKHLQLECTVTHDQFEVSIVNFCHPKDLPKIRGRELDDVRPRGLGTHFIAESSDRVAYAPNGEGGIRLTLTKMKRKKTVRRRRKSS